MHTSSARHAKRHSLRVVPGAAAPVLNDVHSGLNPTPVRAVVRPGSVAELRACVATAAARGHGVSIGGARGAMGGQQFARDLLHIDTRGLNRVQALDREHGVAVVEAGIQWPELIQQLQALQTAERRPWSIRQKQTGSDALCLGGALSANAHGRGLGLQPIVGDVEWIQLVDPDGELRRCSRTENADLFRLAIGGYGLFGVIATVALRLIRRYRVERLVELIDTAELVGAFTRRMEEGCTYGDLQFAVDPESPDFLRRGVFACYRPVRGEDGAPPPAARALRGEEWRELLWLAHTDKRRAFELYADHYRATHGQRYWSDTHQLAAPLHGYHAEIDARLGHGVRGSEMISELYVPRARLESFLEAARTGLRASGADVIYGTIRLIERDDTTFLSWAREPWACVIFNLHVDHTPAGTAQAARDFRMLIDCAMAQGGSYYLTYHRWATAEQLRRCHPAIDAFFELKRRFDPGERFQSDWYHHTRALLAGTLS
ncbi:MAG: FAD-binding oxidoreductase [Planctomycetota bacterium]|jgi:FAD/FMN-containing dehydrogenase